MNCDRSRHRYAALAAAGLLQAACSGDTGPAVEPAGTAASTRTAVLKAGAAVLQEHAPLEPMDMYLVGFHPMKEAPEHQMEAHHYCTQVNEDFAQCVLFDGNTATANLTGIEYIISERLFDTLPAHERRYWHPHNYEILSGQLVAPGLPDIAEHAVMESKMNSYGKTWHVWSTHTAERAGDALPLGEPLLAWSFNRDGEARPGLVEQRDGRMDIDSDERRRARQDLVSLAKPQAGVDALKGAFPRPTRPLPGVEARAAPAAAGAAGSGRGRESDRERGSR